jgi:hypothetical protein
MKVERVKRLKGLNVGILIFNFIQKQIALYIGVLLNQRTNGKIFIND